MVKFFVDIIFGMKDIQKYLGVRKRAVLCFYDKHGLPIKKIGGTWTASKDEIEKWKEENKRLFLIERLKNFDALIAQCKLSMLEQTSSRRDSHPLSTQ